MKISEIFSHRDKYLRHEQEDRTALVDGESTLGPRTVRKRRHETIEAAAKIHGTTNNHSSASYEGLFDTLQKRCKLDTLTT